MIEMFKNLRSVTEDSAAIDKAIINRSSAGWLKLREINGVLYDEHLPVRAMGNIERRWLNRSGFMNHRAMNRS